MKVLSSVGAIRLSLGKLAGFGKARSVATLDTCDVKSTLFASPSPGATAELASLAMRRALTETAGQQGASLFGTTLSDLQAALRTYSTRERFADLAQRFFGDFLARTMRSYVDREIPNLVGVSAGLRTVGDSREAVEAIDRHVRETAFLMRDFAGGWYSKRQWESRGSISEWTPPSSTSWTNSACASLRLPVLRGIVTPVCLA